MIAPQDNTNTTAIKAPAQFDILCGQDNTFSRHEGNKVFKELIDSFQHVYANSTSKHEKMGITREIVSQLQAKFNSRFLKPSENGEWQEITNQRARDKVSHALRFASNNAAPARGSSASPISSSRSVEYKHQGWLPGVGDCSEMSISSLTVATKESTVDDSFWSSQSTATSSARSLNNPPMRPSMRPSMAPSMRMVSLEQNNQSNHALASQLRQDMNLSFCNHAEAEEEDLDELIRLPVVLRISEYSDLWMEDMEH
jgi:hypothetical protein